MNYQFIKKSSNSKTGHIPVTNSNRTTCPNNCKLRDNGACYAQAGYYTRLNWDKIDNGTRGGSWSDLCDQVAALPPGQLWRHNVSGDLPHNDQFINIDKLGALWRANEGKKGFTYTHHDMKLQWNRTAVKLANERGFTVNLSADNTAEADQLAGLGIGPVVCIVSAEYARKAHGGKWLESLAEYKARIATLENLVTPEGRKIVVCPAVVGDTTCKECALCHKKNRAIVAFPAHGGGKNKIEEVKS